MALYLYRYQQYGVSGFRPVPKMPRVYGLFCGPTQTAMQPLLLQTMSGGGAPALFVLQLPRMSPVSHTGLQRGGWSGKGQEAGRHG